jgi:hypothetical protein
MNRNVRSSVLLAACVGLWSCTNDPTADLGGTPDHMVATPSAIFVDQGATEIIEVELFDEQGGQIPASFTVSNPSANIDVTVDDEFLPEYDAEGNLVVPDEVTKLRVNVTGVSAASTSFTVSAGGVSLDIPVRVVPTAFDAAVSDAAPDGGEPVTLTAPAGFAFLADAGVTFETGGDAFIIGNTGTDLTFLPIPGSTGAVTVSNVEVDFLAGTPLTLPLATSITVSTTVANLAGTDLPGTAPLVTAPASGTSFAFADGQTRAGDCGGVPCTWYKLDVAAAGDLDFTSTWSNTTDLGVYVTDGAFATIGGCDAHGNGATAKPEECTITFDAPGIYYIQMQDFGPFYGSDNAEPDWFIISITAP